MHLNKLRMKHLLLIFSFCLLLVACDKKKSGISGKVTYAGTGTPVFNALVNYVQCKTNGENCEEIVIGQCYTNQSGEFVIDQKVASKSKTKWISVYKDNRKIAQKDNIGLNDKNISIE